MLKLRFDRYIINMEFFFLLFEKNGSVGRGDGKRNILLGWPNLETGRNGLKSGVSQIIRES